MTKKEKSIVLSDIGATNIRFALFNSETSQVHDQNSFQCIDFSGFSEAFKHYCELTRTAPKDAVVAVACPVLSDTIQMTNLDWSLSIKELCEELNLDNLRFINDVQAIGYALPKLEKSEAIPIGPKIKPVKDAPFGLVAPGSGLGCTGVLHTNQGTIAIPSEGGHMTLSPQDSEDASIMDSLSSKYGHVSSERLVSGMGIENIYASLCQISGHTPLAKTAPEISQLARENKCLIAARTFHVFSRLLGNFCGNVALMLGARSGIYLGGGVLQKIRDLFDEEVFRNAFENKGRFQGYLSEIPTYQITHPYPAFLGIEEYLSSSLELRSP